MNTTQPNNNNQPTANPVSAPLQTGKKSGKTKSTLIIAVVAAIAVALFLVGYWLLAGMGQNSAKATANNFMAAMTTNNADKALEYAENTSEDTKLFYQSSAAALKGSYKFKQIANKDDAYYVLYTVDGGGNKTAKVKVVKSGNKWLVSDFYYSSGELTTDPASTDGTQPGNESAENQQPQELDSTVEDLGPQ